MRKLLTTIALATVLATPAFAATVHHQAPQSTRQLYMFAPGGAGIADPGARAAAMQECNALAGKWSMSAWQSTQLSTYGSCMAEHGQMP
jgi:hypothetical protein